ncbi:hypothetical protein BO86DRAFT_403264 [Aspergillus japonicus CBS 114.51]|uniref:Uncharacterized protein n=1 Tax=Aspergillus japonicus CBS 114.51 TaxID=1448312 RepID=A0A8T8WQK0_ASPJA|nr:hypothetical protein BO86DRAFT_403264 [Aspergillus japonicus CBS 114.51]RAH77842.1 hypothetical protein BO86DRAFT_403264 [Aspergillus japonicus CBS 114.51]
MPYKELLTMSLVAGDAPSSTPDQYTNGRMPARVQVAIRILDSDDSRTGKLGSRKFDGKFHYSNRGSDTKGVDFRAVKPRSYSTKDLDIEEVEMDSKDFFAGTYWSYAACVTLFETHPKEALLVVPGWKEEGHWIKVWDKYGNFAAFTLGTNDKKTHLVVKGRTVTAEVEPMVLPTDEMPAWVKDLPTDVQRRLPELRS